MKHDIMVRFQGLTMSLRDWSKRLGIDNSVLNRRIKNGWPLRKALTCPPIRKERRRG